ncbi:MAG: hypothetical protein IT435_16855 [Phycisphaerales bacterium]|nr:hypothetical protein [Phycisphaerales bacterium]
MSSTATAQGSRKIRGDAPADRSAPKPTFDADHIIDNVFITPKVLDRRAFDELSAALRQLVRDAASQGQALHGTAGEVKAMGDSLREATRQLQARLEAALKVAPALDQRVAKAEQIVQLAIDRNKLTEHLEASLGQIIDARLADFTRRLTAATAEQEDRLRLLTTRAAEEIDARRARLQADAEQACEQINQARAKLATEAEGLEQITRSQVDSAAERLAEPIRQADKRAADLISRLDAQIETAEDRLRTAREQADLKLANLIDTTARHAETMSRKTQDEVGAVDLRLRELVDQAAGRLVTLRTQADRLDEMAASKIREATAELDQRREQLVEQSRRKLEALLEEALPGLEQRVRESADRQINDALNRHEDQLLAQDARRNEQLDEHARRLESQAGAMEARAEQAAASAADAGAAAADAAMKAGAEVASRLIDLGQGTIDSVSASQASLRDQLAHAENSLAGMVAEIQAQIEPIRRFTQILEPTLDQHVEHFRERLANAGGESVRHLENLCNQASMLVGVNADGTPAPTDGTLASLIDRAAGLYEGVSSAIQRLEELREQADQSRASLGEAIRAAGRPDRPAPSGKASSTHK